MNRPINKLNKKTSLTAKLFLATALMTVTSVSAAEDNDVAYVDSVLTWGAWELDIEPAAGGISAPAPRALNARNAKVALRTNSIAALAPSAPAPGGTQVNPVVIGTPVPQPSPIQPAKQPGSTAGTPAAPSSFAPPGSTTPPPGGVAFAPPAPVGLAPTGAVTTTVVTLP